MPGGKKQRAARWEPDKKKNRLQYNMTHTIKRMCGLIGPNNWTTLVWFGRMSNPAKRDGLIPVRDFSAMTVAIENNGGWQRVVSVGAHVVKGHAMVGGGGFDPLDIIVEKADDAAENGLDGFWRTPQGDFYLRADLPPDYAAESVPEGHLKDVALHPRLALSLFSIGTDDYRENAAARKRLKIVLAEAAEAELTRQLRAPTFFVAAGSKPLVIRALAAEHTREDIAAMDQLTADKIVLGSWVIEERKPLLTLSATMNPDDIAVVKEVLPEKITLKTDTNTIETKNPAAHVRQFIKMRTGYDASDLDVVPLVEVGQQVSNETCLWGPQRQQSISVRSLRPKNDSAANRRANLMGIWSVLSEGNEYGGQVIYDVALVSPRSDARVYVGLFDKEGDPCGAQRIATCGVGAVGAAMATKCRLPGVRINLRNTSIRAWRQEQNDTRASRRQREHREAKK